MLRYQQNDFLGVLYLTTITIYIALLLNKLDMDVLTKTSILSRILAECLAIINLCYTKYHYRIAKFRSYGHTFAVIFPREIENYIPFVMLVF